MINFDIISRLKIMSMKTLCTFLFSLLLNYVVICQAPEAVCGVMYVSVNPLLPDRDGPGSQDVWLIDASELDAGSISNGSPTIQVARHLSTITFDWTTNGACVDILANGVYNNPDKGTPYRNCYPVTTSDFNKHKLYKLRIQDEFGVDECYGTIKVIPVSALQISNRPEVIIFHDANNVYMKWGSPLLTKQIVQVFSVIGSLIHSEAILPGQSELILYDVLKNDGVYVIHINGSSFKMIK